MDPTEWLFEIDQQLRQRGHPPMDASTLKEAYTRLQAPEVVQAFQSGQLTTQQLVEQADQAIQTARKPRGGLPLPQGQQPVSGLAPNGQSAIAGSPPMLLEGAQPYNAFSIGNTPVTQPFGQVLARPEYPGDYIKRRLSKVQGPI